ncbi:uncharacterized protein M6B38_349615 [Iris pallida]|uniref:Uncharacterized protein n=1 Tax=Iris pallida TaxID=29817 RepID=A0AAX6GSN8_IRIPA|nr:uncharacterized protein M6B38_349615 [Iris pallida]
MEARRCRICALEAQIRRRGRRSRRRRLGARRGFPSDGSEPWRRSRGSRWRWEEMGLGGARVKAGSRRPVQCDFDAGRRSGGLGREGDCPGGGTEASPERPGRLLEVAAAVFRIEAWRWVRFPLLLLSSCCS